MRDDSDAPMVLRVLAGESEAYAGLVARYRDRLGRYAVRMLGNHADAEEALQDTFFRGYRSLARCSDPERFGAWLFGILVNRCRTYGARRTRRQRVMADDEPALARAAVRPDAEGYAWREAIEQALDELAPDQREAFLLKHVEELTYDEMAETTGVSVSALKMRVLRAREVLRRVLMEDEGD